MLLQNWLISVEIDGVRARWRNGACLQQKIDFFVKLMKQAVVTLRQVSLHLSACFTKVRTHCESLLFSKFWSKFTHTFVVS